MHGFGYATNLPWGNSATLVDTAPLSEGKLTEPRPLSDRAKGELQFSLARWLGISKSMREPVSVEAKVYVQRIGAVRQLISVVGNAPNLDHRLRVRKIRPQVKGLELGTVMLTEREPVRLGLSYSVLMGDPYAFTYDEQERRALRRAIERIERFCLSGSRNPVTLNGLPEDLIVTCDTTSILPPNLMESEIDRQLRGASRVESWGYLWNVNHPPEPSDAAEMLESPDLTTELYEALCDIGETLVRGLGVKPGAWSARREEQAFEWITWALVAIRTGSPHAEVVQRLAGYFAQYAGEMQGPSAPGRPERDFSEERGERTDAEGRARSDDGTWGDAGGGSHDRVGRTDRSERSERIDRADNRLRGRLNADKPRKPRSKRPSPRRR